jgi:hypothetical protein
MFSSPGGFLNKSNGQFAKRAKGICVVDERLK